MPVLSFCGCDGDVGVPVLEFVLFAGVAGVLTVLVEAFGDGRTAYL